MPHNIEIKARIDHPAELFARVRALADHGPTVIIQDDTFYNCSNGRLKLREFADGQGELIFYQRPDFSGPKESRYFISPTSSPQTLRQVLAAASGECGRVRKKRTLFRVGNTRIHLDEVEGLGEFLELEVVLREDETVEAGVHIAQKLLSSLSISESQLVRGAYVDLLSEKLREMPQAKG